MTGADWGLCHTVERNLGKVASFAREGKPLGAPFDPVVQAEALLAVCHGSKVNGVAAAQPDRGAEALVRDPRGGPSLAGQHPVTGERLAPVLDRFGQVTQNRRFVLLERRDHLQHGADSSTPPSPSASITRSASIRPRALNCCVNGQ